MGDIVSLARPAARPAPRSFEDPRLADWHSPVEAAPAAEAAKVGGPEDCICTAGTVCRHNNACPRRTRPAAIKPTLVGG